MNHHRLYSFWILLLVLPSLIPALWVWRFPLKEIVEEVQPVGINRFIISPAGLGYPRQNFDWLIDTGSNFPWIYSSDCQDTAVCERRPRYNHALSRAYIPNGHPVEASYFGGSVAGFESVDLFNMTLDPYLFVDHFGFGEITKSSLSFASNQWSGLLGFTYPNLNPFPCCPDIVPLFTRIVEARASPKSVLSFEWPRAGEIGLMVIGEISNQYGPLTSVPIVKNYNPNIRHEYYWWIIPISDVLLNGVSTGYCKKYQCNAILDTGAGPMFVSGSVKKEQITVRPDCSNLGQLPNITFVVGGTHIVFGPTDYSLRYQGHCQSQIVTSTSSPAEKSKLRQLSVPSNNEAVTLEPGQMQFGAPWFAAVYTAFDADSNQIHLARKR